MEYPRHGRLRADGKRFARQVVVKLGASRRARRALHSLATGRETKARAKAGPLERVLVDPALESMTPLFPRREAARGSGAARMLASVEAEPEGELAGLNLLDFRDAEAAQSACRALCRDAAVEYAHVVQERFPFAARRKARRSSSGNDPLSNRQWGLRAIELFQARESGDFPDSREIEIAVIDTGVDAKHPELRRVIAAEEHYGRGQGRDTVGHGTHVAGIVAAERNNRIGIMGVCESRRVLSFKALGPYSAEAYYRSLREATDRAKVINLSLGGDRDPTEELLVERAIRRGVVVVAAMGNEYLEGNPRSYPAAIGLVIGVGATDESDRRAPFSNTGAHINLCAPGVNVLSTVPTYPSSDADGTDYEAWPGTSMAAPHVAAAAALLLARKPGATVRQVSRALERGADKVDRRRGFTHAYGHGRLNVRRALAAI